MRYSDLVRWSLMMCITPLSLASVLNFRDLPMFPAGLFARFEGNAVTTDIASSVSGSRTSSHQKIPKNVWIAVVNVTEVELWENVIDMRKKNSDWKFYIWDNKDKDKFMQENFMGSKLLWAYENINPSVGGAAKADIWRYAVLLLIGGVCK
jgi:mannosyltransferase OCH1-like enzyme